MKWLPPPRDGTCTNMMSIYGVWDLARIASQHATVPICTTIHTLRASTIWNCALCQNLSSLKEQSCRLIKRMPCTAPSLPSSSLTHQQVDSVQDQLPHRQKWYLPRCQNLTSAKQCLFASLFIFSLDDLARIGFRKGSLANEVLLDTRGQFVVGCVDQFHYLVL